MTQNTIKEMEEMASAISDGLILISDATTQMPAVRFELLENGRCRYDCRRSGLCGTSSADIASMYECDDLDWDREIDTAEREQDSRDC